MMDVADSDFTAGTRWAYRARAVDPLVEVEVIRLGTTRPQRVLVRWIADEFEGKTEWVPPARLKTAWADVDSFVANETRWEAARSTVDRRRDELELDAILSVEAAVDVEAFTTGYNADEGLLFVHDVDQLAAQTGLTMDWLMQQPAVFVDTDGVVVAGWPAARIVFERLAPAFADRILAELAEEDSKYQRWAAHGKWVHGRRGDRGLLHRAGPLRQPTPRDSRTPRSDPTLVRGRRRRPPR